MRLAMSCSKSLTFSVFSSWSLGAFVVDPPWSTASAWVRGDWLLEIVDGLELDFIKLSTPPLASDHLFWSQRWLPLLEPWMSVWTVSCVVLTLVPVVAACAALVASFAALVKISVRKAVQYWLWFASPIFSPWPLTQLLRWAYLAFSPSLLLLLLSIPRRRFMFERGMGKKIWCKLWLVLLCFEFFTDAASTFLRASINMSQELMYIYQCCSVFRASINMPQEKRYIHQCCSECVTSWLAFAVGGTSFGGFSFSASVRLKPLTYL